MQLKTLLKAIQAEKDLNNLDWNVEHYVVIPINEIDPLGMKNIYSRKCKYVIYQEQFYINVPRPTKWLIVPKKFNSILERELGHLGY